MGTGKRLVQYAVNFKGVLIVGLIMLAIAVAADLAAPLIAKEIIDNHIAVSGNAVDFEPIAYLLGLFFTLPLSPHFSGIGNLFCCKEERIGLSVKCVTTSTSIHKPCQFAILIICQQVKWCRESLMIQKPSAICL